MTSSAAGYSRFNQFLFFSRKRTQITSFRTMLFFVTAFTRECFELAQLRSSASNPPTRKASLCSAKVVDYVSDPPTKFTKRGTGAKE